MYSKSIILATLLVASGVQAQNPIIQSIIGEISAGLVSGRASGVPESQAASEVNEILAVLNTDSNVQNLLSQGANLVIGGINSSNLISFASAAQASLAALQGSPDGTSVAELISSHGTDLDATSAFSIITSTLSPILQLILPSIQSLSSGDANVAAAVNDLTSAALSLVNSFGLLNPHTAAPSTTEASAASTTEATSTTEAATTTEAASTTEAPTSTEAPTTSAAPTETSKSAPATTEASSESAAATTEHTSTAAPTTVATKTTGTAPGSTTAAQVNGVSQNSVGIVVAGAAAAAGLLFL